MQPMSDGSSLETFSFIQPRDIVWGEMDALGHVNNTVYFRYFEQARISIFEAAGFHTKPEAGFAPIVAEVRCRFRMPLTYPERIRVGTRFVRWGTTSVVMEHGIFTADGRLAAEGDAVIVWYDYHEARKAAWPEAVKDALTQAEQKGWPGLG
jgi:acyl-CoA thioester hydrolase